MKVLMFGWEFPPHNSGGLGVACYGLARALACQKTDINFVLPREVSVKADFLNFVFADVKQINVEGISSNLKPYVTSQGYLKSLSKLVGKNVYGKNLFEEVERYAMEGGRIARKTECDIIHAHDWLSFGAGVEAREVVDRPLVVHVHATEFDRTGGLIGDERVHEVEKSGMEEADKIIAVSGFTKNIIVKKYGIDPSKVEVVHNGIDKASYFLDAKSLGGLNDLKKLGYKIVLFVGRITLSKGVDYLLTAAKQVLAFDPKILFIIAGSGDMERQIINQAATLGISSNICFAGFARGEELSKLYKSADLFVMPSVSEPFGLTAIESLIHKTPVLISKQSGVSEVINHALKTDFWDTEEMSNKILSTLTHQSLQQTLSQNGEKEASKCSWEDAAKKCIKIYNQLGV